MISNSLKNISIKNKLILIILGIVLFSTGIAFSIVIINQVYKIKREMVNTVIVNARLIGEYCVTPLTFNDKSGANEILQKMHLIPSILDVVFFNENGEVFAHSDITDNDRIPNFEYLESIPAEKFEKNYLIIFKPVIYHNMKYGTIYIKASTAELRMTIKNYIIKMIFIELCLILLVFVLAYKFQNIISKPILELKNVMEKISKANDYSLRVKRKNQDEIGSLYDGFNNMLKQIHIRQIKREQAEKELYEAKEQFSTFMNQLPGRVLIKEMDSTIIYVNQYMEDIFGNNNWIGKIASDYMTKDQAEKVLKNDKTALETGKCKIIEAFKDINGKIRYYQTIKFPILRPDSPPRIGVIGLDITELKNEEERRIKLENQLRQAQKMEAIGTLAGGIAHDFNNILSPIMGYSEMLKSDILNGKFLKVNEINEVLLASQRAKDLVKQILTFSRQTEEELKPLKIETVIKESMKLLRASLPSTINIVHRIYNDCGYIKGDPTRIQQIIMNLFTNAYHAMEKSGGKIEIEVQKLNRINKNIYKELNLSSNNYLQVTVSDNGHGMDSETRERIFDPYFTTKDPSKGTGLGLSIVHGIVNSLNGEIKVESEIGKGTTFYIYFPLLEEKPVQNKTKADNIIQKGSEKILLVDDEKQIVEMITQMLIRLGYSVTSKTNSTEALNEFLNNTNKYECVISDLTMPNMTGEELAAKIFEIKPDIPVILITGYKEKIDDRKENFNNIKAIINKPFSLREIAKIIRDVL